MSNQKSFNQLIKYLETFSDDHKQLQTFGVGFRFDLNKTVTETNNFPILYVQPISHNINKNVQNYTLRIYVHDLKQKDSSNEIEVLSDTLQIINDLYKYIKNDTTNNDYDIVNIPVSFPNTNYTTEFTTGWFSDFQIQVTLNESQCDIPLT